MIPVSHSGMYHTGQPVTAPDNGGGLGAGAIVGIVLFVIALLAVAVIVTVVLAYFCIQKGTFDIELVKYIVELCLLFTQVVSRVNLV